MVPINLLHSGPVDPHLVDKQHIHRDRVEEAVRLGSLSVLGDVDAVPDADVKVLAVGHEEGVVAVEFVGIGAGREILVDLPRHGTGRAALTEVGLIFPSRNVSDAFTMLPILRNKKIQKKFSLEKFEKSVQKDKPLPFPACFFSILRTEKNSRWIDGQVKVGEEIVENR